MTNALTAYSAELAWRIRTRDLLRGTAETYRLMAQVKQELKELDIKYRQRMQKALNHV